MGRETGMFLRDPFNCHLDRAGHAQSCTLRGGTGTAVASSASNSPAKLFAERFDFVFGLGDALRISEFFGFLELFAELFKLTAVLAFAWASSISPASSDAPAGKFRSANCSRVIAPSSARASESLRSVRRSGSGHQASHKVSAASHTVAVCVSVTTTLLIPSAVSNVASKHSASSAWPSRAKM